VRFRHGLQGSTAGDCSDKTRFTNSAGAPP
jgi:hypothetical protein